MQKLRTSLSASNLTNLAAGQSNAEPSEEYKWFRAAVKRSQGCNVPPSDDRVKLDALVGRVQTGFSVSLSTIDGLKNSTEQVFVPGLSVVRLQLSIFDSGCKQFLGRTWVGPEVNYKENGKISYNQTVYLHSSLNDPGILLVFEIVVTTGGEAGQKETFGCGWGFHRLFKSDVKTVDLSDISPASAKKIEIFHGSPQVLLYIDGEIEGNQNLVRTSYHLFCAVQVHRLLLKVLHLFPENVIVGQREPIPGLVGGQKDPKTGVIDNLRRPRLAKALRCSLESITVRLNPSIEKFEEELCRQVLEEYVVRAQPPSTGKGIQVTKRFLRVGVHNGWTFLAQPEEIQLNPSSESVTLNRLVASFRRGHQRSSSSSHLISGATGLVHKSRVDIEGLLQDAMLHIVFTLVYQVAVPDGGRDEFAKHKTSLAQPVLDVVICWGAVSPLASPDTGLHTVQLFGGCLANPDSTFVYRGSVGGAKATDSYSSVVKAGTDCASGTVTFTLNKTTELTYQESRAEVDTILVPPTPVNEISSRSLISLTSEDADLLREAKRGTAKTPVSSRSRRDLQQTGISPRPAYDPQGYTVPYLPYPQSYLHGVMMSQLSARDGLAASVEMQELPYTPIHFPILATVPGMHSGQGLSRAAYAKLHSVGFPPILGRTGAIAEAVDPSDYLNFVLAKEDADRLKVNEITLQFMAFTRLSGFEPQVNAKKPGTVFFTFQFYRFEQVTSERLLLGTLDGDGFDDRDSIPFVLQRIDRDGAVVKGPPGFQVKYDVDPTYMKEGEGQLFAKYLAEQTLHIDVWDGDSLLLIGSAIVELRHLCRQGREAVQVSYELDVIMTEYIEQEVLPSGDVSRDGGVMPVDVNNLVRGRLHLKLGNAGRTLDTKIPRTKKALHMKTGRQVISMDELPTTVEELARTRVGKAQHLADISQELAQLIRTRRQKTDGDDGGQNVPAEKTKKISRMEAVRQMEKMEDTAPTLSFRKEKDERFRDLKTIELFRSHNKRENIINMLNVAITSEHVIYASLGTTEFFEFVLKNPYNVEITVSIEWKDADLEVVTNPIEWRHLKMVNEVHTPLEERMFNTESKSGRPEIFLRAKESVYVPFKYLTFRSDHSVQLPMPNDPHRTVHDQENLARKNDQNQSRTIKVCFSNPDMKPLAILSLRVEHQPHIIDQTFRLYHPEQTFLKKSFRLPPLHSITDLPVGGPAISQVFVRCSDSNVICETRKVAPGEPHDVFIKVILKLYNY